MFSGENYRIYFCIGRERKKLLFRLGQQNAMRKREREKFSSLLSLSFFSS
jgi:hypothetical protein